MSTPNLGTIVIYHNGSEDWPAIVAVTNASWQDYLSTGDYAVSPQPAADEVYLFPFMNMVGEMPLAGPCTEGTDTGQYSLPNYQTQAV